MSSVSAADIGSCRYFLPHHCVIKEDSSTTKLRLVFYGSAVSSSGYSLIDVLIAGPVILLLLRFRSHPAAITGDICRMYGCVRVQPEDSPVFKLDTVTYGTKPASFLAVRAMHQLSADEHR